MGSFSITMKLSPNYEADGQYFQVKDIIFTYFYSSANVCSFEFLDIKITIRSQVS